MGSLGLVSVLGWPYFAGLALVTAGIALELLHTPLRSNRLVFLIVVLVVFLFATASAVEPIAGTQSAFVVAGFVQHIYVHGQPLINYDERFSVARKFLPRCGAGGLRWANKRFRFPALVPFHH